MLWHQPSQETLGPRWCWETFRITTRWEAKNWILPVGWCDDPLLEDGRELVFPIFLLPSGDWWSWTCWIRRYHFCKICVDFRWFLCFLTGRRTNWQRTEHFWLRAAFCQTPICTQYHPPKCNICCEEGFKGKFDFLYLPIDFRPCGWSTAVLGRLIDIKLMRCNDAMSILVTWL